MPPVPRPLSPVPPREALTLIELMVVIVILTTLVAGVLPLVSPNNDARKIREASRGLQTYLMQAQAEAARLGRPVGVSFVESSPGSGVALEAYQIQVPQPFAGTSRNSRAQIRVAVDRYDAPLFYGLDPRQLANKYETRFPRYKGRRLYNVQTITLPNPNNIETGRIVNTEIIPPGMLRVGDVFDLEGNLFLVADVSDNILSDPTTGVVDVEQLGSAVVCIWLNEQGQAPRKFYNPGTLDFRNEGSQAEPGAAYRYQLYRQPLGYDQNNRVMSSAAAPYQFPAGVALDLQACGIEPIGNEMATVATQQDIVDQQDATDLTNLATKQFSLLFSPSGEIEKVWINEQQVTQIARIFLLMGRIENGNYDFTNDGVNQWMNIAEEEVTERRKEINWLNLNSRWIMVNATSGKFSVEENASRVLTGTPLQDEFATLKNKLEDNGRIDVLDSEILKMVQIEEAHALAHGRPAYLGQQ